jgi:drug/metabolite transporter (DMT)-like permease
MPGLRRFPLPLIAAFFALVCDLGLDLPGNPHRRRILAAADAGRDSLRHCRELDVCLPALAWSTGADLGAMESRRHYRGVAAGFGNGAVSVAEHTGVASGVAALAVATVPLFTLLCGYLWGARNTRLEWAGIVLGLIGIAMLNMGSNLQSSPWARRC